MRFHPIVPLVAACAVAAAACSSGGDTTSSESAVEESGAEPGSLLDRLEGRGVAPTPEPAEAPTGDATGTDAATAVEPGDTTAALRPTADPAEAIPGGVASDLILVQDFGGAAQLASYEPDGDLVATYLVSDVEVSWLPIWAPDGRSVAWASTIGDGAWSLTVADVDGTIRGTYDLPDRPDYLRFDPTADRIVSLTPSPNGFGLVVIDLDSGESTLVDLGRPYFSDFSPDGDRLVAHVEYDLRIVSTDGEVVELPVATDRHQTPEWHPDGDRLVFTTAADDAILVEYDVATGEVDEIATFADFLFFDVDPTGRAVAVSTFDSPTLDATSGVDVDTLRATVEGAVPPGLWVVELDTGAATQLSPEPTIAPLFDPTGSRVLVRDAAGGSGTWTVYATDGTELTSVTRDVSNTLLPNYLPFWDQHARSQTLWAPSGDRFVHVGTDTDGRTGVWIHDATLGGESTFLVDGENAIWSPT